MKLITPILLCLLALAMPLAAKADDTRTPLTEVVATSEYADIIGYGKTVATPHFDIPDRSANVTKCYWTKKNDAGVYAQYEGSTFEAGIYHLLVEVHATTSTHFLVAGWKFIVNDIEWTTLKPETAYAETWAMAISPDIIVKEPVTDVVATSNYLDIAGYGEPVKAPTFTLEAGSPVKLPDDKVIWAKKTDNGKWYEYNESTFVPGTYKLTVMARGDDPNYTLATTWKMTVNGTEWTTKEPIDKDTYIYDWADSPEFIVREPVTDVVATSNYLDIAVYGEPVKAPTFTLEAGSPVKIPDDNIIWAKKTDNGKWYEYNESTFVPGTYKLTVMARVDDPNYTLATTWKMTVNGTEWTTKEPIDNDTYIYAWADSPEIIVDDSGIDNVSTDGTNATANVHNLQGIVVKRDTSDLSGLPSGIYIIGGKKVLVK